MSTQGASTSSLSSSSTPWWTYDVFLSFRGEDTRKSFTDHLYNALIRKGIVTFRDDEKLERGKFISQELVKAIEESRFAIVIFSTNFAFSTWCLDELVHIVRCSRRKEKKLEVFPIFYHVEPSDVRKQKGTFAEAFDKYKESSKESIEKVEIWRSTLTAVANLSGWDLQDRHESEFIQQIVEEMMKKLSSKFLRINKNFIGIESIVEELIPSYLDFEDNVCMIGICGMGGIGKTTLAKVVYERYSDQFEVSSFIADVREKSEKGDLLQLQKQFLKEGEINAEIWDVHQGVDIIKNRLCRKKVLLVLDDVNHVNQLENLAGEPHWFGSGSRIIITTRDEHVLVQHGVLKIYKPNGLKNNDASKLFCLKAFKNEQPKEGYTQLSQEVVKYAGGLPLALVTLGSFLIGRKIDEWQSALDYLKKEPKKEIFDVLKISYDGLEEMWKEIFLDIACFFKGWSKFEVICILENCDFNARIGISVLLDKSLLTVTGHDEKLGMHDLLQEMGEKIVRRQSCRELGRQSRLWLIEDLFHVLENNMATNAIQAIIIKIWKADFNFEEFSEVFSKMTNLRLLIIDGLNIPNALNCVPNGLRHLSWKYCPLKCLPSSFQPKELVELDLLGCECEDLWEGAKCLGKLKSFNLSHSNNLIWTPDFSKVTRLEVLSLYGCTNLVGLHTSIGQLSKLKSLKLCYCKSLTNLPSFSEATGLEVLSLYGCTNLVGLHPSIGQLNKLKNLNLCYCKFLTNLPSFSEATGLEVLVLHGCTNLVGLHPSIGQLSKLKSLNLGDCKSLTNLPSFSEATGLEVLSLHGCTNLVGLHPSIGQLSKLKSLDLRDCKSLTNLPSFSEATRLEELDLYGCTNLVRLHLSIGQLSKLKSLNLSDCKSLTNLPSFSEATGLEELDLHGCTNLVGLHPSIGQLSKLKSLNLCDYKSLTNLPSFSEATRLEKLDLYGCTNLVGLHPSIGQLSKLKRLNLSDCKSLTNLPSFSEAMGLEELDLHGCTNLVGLHPSIGQLSKLKSLNLCDYKSLTNLPSFSEATRLEKLDLYGCTNLVGLHPSIGQLSKLKRLNLSDCKSLTNLPSFSEAMGLEELDLHGCTNLVGLHPSIGQLSKLKRLYLHDCKSLTNLPSFSEATGLELLSLYGCTNLVGLHPSIGQLSKLESLNLRDCKSLTNLPSFSEATGLEVLGLYGCTNLVGLHPSIGQLSKLESLNLRDCKSLTNLPSFSEATRLEELDLDGCTNLVGLHPSIGQLSKLKSLNLCGCKSLTNLPSLSAKMESLTSIVLSNCSKIEKFPEFKGTMKSLSQIAWNWPTIEEIPCSSIECLTPLKSLGLIGCTDLECLPSNMDSLRSLKLFYLSGCSKLTNLPENLWKIKCLERLALDGISQLEEIELNGIGCLSSLKYLSLSWNNFVTLPAIFSQLSKLETLNLCGCKKLRSVPELPSTMRYINMVGCCSLEPLPGLLRQSSLPQPYSSPFFGGYDESSGGVAFTILKHYLQGLLCEKTGYETEFQICIPGCLVPRWLTHQSRENSISVVLPPNWCNSRWMGFTLCALFNEEANFSGKFKAYVKAIGDMPHSQYVFKNLVFGGCRENHVYSFHDDWFSTVGDSECKQLENHVWLLYLSRDDWFITVGNGECRQIEVVFKYDNYFSIPVNPKPVKRCGVSLVYKQDLELMEELNQANAQCYSSSRVITFEGWDGVHHGYVNSKRSRDECDDEFDDEFDDD